MKGFKTILLSFCFCSLLRGQNIDSIFYSGLDTAGLSHSIDVYDAKQELYRDKVVTQVFTPSIHQDQIVRFIYDNKGKKVGTGKCWDLVNECFIKWDKSWWAKSSPYGTLINHVDVLPGDIILTTEEVDLDGRSQTDHIVIVYAVENGVVWVAEQGGGTNVDIRIFDYDVEKEGSRKISIKCYRPM